MKTSWVLFLILVLGISATTSARAQTTTSTPATDVSFTNPPFGNPVNSTIQQSNNQISGAPSIIGTNSIFGRAFESTTGAQTAATMTNVSVGNRINSTIQQSNNPISGVPSITNFLFVSSIQSWVGQGQSLFAAPTNGYNVQLYQISPDILQFNISPTDSVVTNWTLEFSCTNDAFTAGIYSNAMIAGGSPASLVFAGMGRGDNTSEGFFDVREAAYSSNQLISFAADFIQYDNDDTNAWNEGSIRYNSSIPDTINMFSAPIALSRENGNAVLSWSTNLVGFELEYATNLPPGIWFTNNSTPAIVDGRYTVTVTNGLSAGTRLYRLMKPL